MIVKCKGSKELSINLINGFIRGLLSDLNLNPKSKVFIETIDNKSIFTIVNAEYIIQILKKDLTVQIFFHNFKNIDINMLEYRMSLIGIKEFNYG